MEKFNICPLQTGQLPNDQELVLVNIHILRVYSYCTAYGHKKNNTQLALINHLAAHVM